MVIFSLWSSDLFSQITTVPLGSKDLLTNEPCISVDPRKPRFQFAGSNVNYVHTSSDYGLSWNTTVLNSKYGFYGDPVTFISKKGIYYLLHLAQNPDLKYPEMFDRIVLQQSSDRGQNFDEGVSIGWNRNKMQDKPWISLDESRSKHKGSIYVSWTEFDKYGSANPKDSSRIRFSCSRDGGKSFSDAITVSDTSGDCRDDDGTMEGATTAVGRKGEVYMVWAGNEKIYFDKSTDGGKTWGKDKILVHQPGGWTQEIKAMFRSNSMPFIVTDKKGTIYVCWGDNRYGDYDIFLLISKDGGENWEPVQRVNSDAQANGCDQFMPHICTDRKTGTLYLVYYDKRNSQSNTFFDIYMSSLRKGKKWSHHRITNQIMAPAGKDVFFGDYISVSAEKDEVRTAYNLNNEGAVTVEVALLNRRILKRTPENRLLPGISAWYDKAERRIILNSCLAENSGYEIQALRGKELIYRRTGEAGTGGFTEDFIQIRNLTGGWIDLRMKSGSDTWNTLIYLD